MPGVDEPGLDSGSNLSWLVIFNRPQQRFEPAHISFFEQRFKRCLAGVDAILVLALEVRFLELERVLEDQSGDVESRLRPEDWALVALSRQNRQSSYVIQVAMRQHHCVQLAAFQFCRAAVFAFLSPAALKQTAVNQDAGVPGHDVIRRSGNIARSPMELNLHNALLKL